MGVCANFDGFKQLGVEYDVQTGKVVPRTEPAPSKKA